MYDVKLLDLVLERSKDHATDSISKPAHPRESIGPRRVLRRKKIRMKHEKHAHVF